MSVRVVKGATTTELTGEGLTWSDVVLKCARRRRKNRRVRNVAARADATRIGRAGYVSVATCINGDAAAGIQIAPAEQRRINPHAERAYLGHKYVFAAGIKGLVGARRCGERSASEAR